MSSEALFGWLTHRQTDRQTYIHTYMVKAVPAFAVAAGKHWQKRLCGAKEMHCEVAGIVTKEITHPVTVASSSVNLWMMDEVSKMKTTANWVESVARCCKRKTDVLYDCSTQASWSLSTPYTATITVDRPVILDSEVCLSQSQLSGRDESYRSVSVVQYTFSLMRRARMDTRTQMSFGRAAAERVWIQSIRLSTRR